MIRLASGKVRADRPSRTPASFVEVLENRTLLATTAIMALGDSITQGDTANGDYRYWLYKSLVAGGYDVNFVGSETQAWNGPRLYNDYDFDNEGHAGQRADQIAASTIAWATANKPDVVLLHAGTNDVIQSQTTASTVSDVGQIIDALRTVNPNVTVAVAQIIPSTNNLTATQQYNAALPALVSGKNTAQSKVVLVDQYTGISTSTDLWDGIHPTESGDKKMAAKWYTALQGILTVTPPPPPPVAGTKYVSDLTPTSSVNGYGPIEKDKSNGENGAGDGKAITLNGKTYTKGLGTHAASDVRYNLAGGYTTFTSDIGVDDEVPFGTVVFQVYLDGVKAYDSGAMGQTTATKSISLNVAGKKELRLVVTNGGDNTNYDHADWADAKLVPVPVGPKLIVTPGSITVAETSKTKFDVTLSAAPAANVTVSIARLAGGDTDLSVTTPATATLTFTPANWNVAQSVFISDANDADFANGTATFRVTATGYNSADVVATEQDDDTPPNAVPVANADGATTTANTAVTVGVLANDTDSDGTLAPASVVVSTAAANGATSVNTTTGAITYTPASGFTGSDSFYYTVKDNLGAVSAPAKVTVTVNATPPVGSEVYLSSLTPTLSTNGYGPVEKDRSNGENGATDGNVLTLNGKTYAKGLGTHAASEVRYNLGGLYANFLSDVGLDDEVLNFGSVNFQVYLDGTLAYDSGKMTGASATKSIAIDVTGKSVLRLVVTDGGDGNTYDHADWAGAKLLTGSLPPPPPPPTGQVYVSDLNWNSNSVNFWGPAEKDRSNGEQGAADGGAITLNDKQYTKGIGTHASSDLYYDISGFSTFQSDIGIDDEVGTGGSVIFRVYGDDVLLYDSGAMTGESATKSISVNVAGKTSLRLSVFDNGTPVYDHADWANARLVP